MKKIHSALAFLFLMPSFSQSAETQEPSLALEPIQSGFVLAPDFKLSEVDGELANLVGGYGGWLSDRKLFIGAGAYWLTHGSAGSELSYGGAVVEWFPHRNRRFNFSVRGLVGAGTGTLPVDFQDLPARAFRSRGRGERSHRLPSTVLVQEGFFVAEPQANASFTLNRWFRIGLGAGYRLISGASGLESRLRGPTASVSLQFGSF